MATPERMTLIMIPAWLHLGPVLFGVLIGATAVSVFWLWVIERRDLAVRSRDRLAARQASEQDAQIRGLYQQTERLGRLVIEHAPPPRAPHRSCQLVWPTTPPAPADAAGSWTARES